MTAKIDEAGRVILPESIRDRLGVAAGSDLEVQETPEGVLLRRSESRSSVVKDELGLWVYTGELPPGFDLRRAIEEDREDRMRKLANP